jgi:hypothetical protein
MFGRFTPTLEMRSSNGATRSVEMDPIWVIPSWWYMLALGVAVAVPLGMRRRSKRRYESLLARLEAAEGRTRADSDADSWNDGDEWSGGR